jgi:hypothetical protein
MLALGLGGPVDGRLFEGQQVSGLAAAGDGADA